MEQVLSERDIQQITESKKGVLAGYQRYHLPVGAQTQWSEAQTSYDEYLVTDNLLSPENKPHNTRVNDKGHTESYFYVGATSSMGWFNTIYQDLELFGSQKASDYHQIRDAAILMARLEGSVRWRQGAEREFEETEKLTPYLLAIVWRAVAIWLFAWFTYEVYAAGAFGGFLRIVVTLAILATFYFPIQSFKRRKESLPQLEQKRQWAATLYQWHHDRAVEHPLVQAHWEIGSLSTFLTWLNYFDQSRVNSLQEAINLYHQEMHNQAMMNQQVQMAESMKRTEQMVTVNTLYNIFSDRK